MNNVKTNWTTAMVNINEALLAVISCLDAGKNAWLEIRDNGDQEYPIQIVNPDLDNPFNWEAYMGIPRCNKKHLNYSKPLNETEKILEDEYTQCFGTEEAIKIYQETGKITKGLINSMGISHPVRMSDANLYRKEISKDNYVYGSWMNLWKPKKSVDILITDPTIEKVFVVCYNDELASDRKESVAKAIELLQTYLKMM